MPIPRASRRPIGILVTGPRRIRVDGVAELVSNHPLLAKYPEAQFLILVKAISIYPNCPRYIHQFQLVERSRFVPQVGAQTPVPDWKRADWAADVLPADDPARDR